MLDYPQLPSDLFQGSYRPLVLDWDELRVRDCNACSHLGQSPAAARGVRCAREKADLRGIRAVAHGMREAQRARGGHLARASSYPVKRVPG